MRRITVIAFLVLVGTGSPAGRAANSEETTYTVTTYASIGLYHKANSDGTCRVRYRPKGSESWRQGLDLVYDSRVGHGI